MLSLTPGSAAARGCPRETGFLSFGLPLLTLFILPTVGFAASDTLSYARDIRPILKEQCYVCHGEGAKESDLDLRTRESILAGGKHGPSVIPGKPSESLLYLHVSGTAGPPMPLGGALEDDQIMAIRDWVEQGAVFDTDVGAAAQPEETWWAFQQPIEHAPPSHAGPQHPIDAFVFAKLAEQDLTPAPPSDRRTLIRRAYLDLIGLLPKPQEVEHFVNDSSPKAFEQVVDRLLASPHYGERWGRHWLDVVRYADSHGYEHDYDFPNAWRYRDYVIKAFNEDKPYDEFVREQLAGDELDESTHDSLIATGFYRVGPRVGFREKDNPQYRYAYLDDIIGTTSRAFMALSVDCARCHDHKFDPISQLDYYRMMAIFFPYVPYDHPLAPKEKVEAYEAKKATVNEHIQPLKRRVADIQAPYKATAFEERLKKFPDDIQKAVHTPEDQRTPGQKLLADQVLSIGPGSVKHLLTPEDKADVNRLQTEISRIEEHLPKPLPLAMGVRDGDYRFAPDGRGDEVKPGKGERESYDFEGSFLPVAGKPFSYPKAHLLPTGDHRTKGPEVEPGFLSVLRNSDAFEPRPPSNRTDTTGYRRAFAEWLTADEHPLTARVMANRIWAYHFGRGLVTTAGNFGRLGQKPTHPKLLDWLAIRFREKGWSIKAMHRLIMSSRTYQMSAAGVPTTNSSDPMNRYLWRFPQRRLEAETIRDIVLDTAGSLNPRMGGTPFFPPIPKSVWRSFGKGIWVLTKEGPEVWRRSIYSYWKRGLRYPMFEVLDQPDPNITCERRNVSTVPTQALTLLNNPFLVRQTNLFAQRVAETRGPDDDSRIRGAYEIALSRAPSDRELQANLMFLSESRARHADRRSDEPALDALVDLCSVILNLNEFVYLN